MNFKQKLAYMAIGCVFTLAGYFLAILGTGGINLQNASAQDKTKQVIDEIVCRKLKVVNPDGKTVAILEVDPFSKSRGMLTLSGFSRRFPDSQRLWFTTMLSPGSINLYQGSGLDRNKRNTTTNTTTISINSLYIAGDENAIQLSENHISIFNKDENVFQAGIHNKGGGMIVTWDKLGNETGRLPR